MKPAKVEVNPYNDQHYDLMCQGSRSCAQTAELLERLQRAGLDTSVQIGENAIQKQIFEGLKREFFPDRP